MITLSKPRFEHYEEDPIGIGLSTPRISWGFSGTVTHWYQEAYELQIQWPDQHIEHFLVESRDNILVPWPGRPLNSRERASIRVRVRETGERDFSQWSAWSTVEAGLLDPGDWCCRLIQPSRNIPPGQPHRPVVFRRQHKLRDVVVSARLCITAHGVYEACVNGKVVGDHVLAPGWTSYHHRLAYQTFDVLSHLQADKDLEIEVTVAEGWFCGRLGFLGGRTNIYGDSLGLIAQLHIVYQDGNTDLILTHDEWTWSDSNFTASGLYDGETHDATLTEFQRKAVKCEPLPSALVASTAPPVRRTEELPVREVLRTPSGKCVLDFGQNFSGRVRLRVSAEEACEIVLRHAEVLDHGEVAMHPLRGAKATDILKLSSNTIEWEPKFTFNGFRYVQVDGWPGELDKTMFDGVVLHTDMQRKGRFQCSNPMWNRLHRNIVWSMRSNFLSIPTDCPQRDERLGWTGDIAVFSDTANFLYDTTRMISSWLEDLSAEQLENNGIVPLTIPNVVEGLEKDAHAIWGDAAIMVPWSLWRASGDKHVLSQQFASMKAWYEAVPRRSNGLWNYTSEWKLGDWLDPLAPPEDPGNTTTDPNFVSDVFLVHVTETMSSVCELLNDKSAQDLYASEAKRLRKSFTDEYVIHCGRLSPDTQTAYVLALHFDLLPLEHQKLRAAERLQELIRRGSRFCIATGFAGTPYIGHALSKVGLPSLFYRMLLHRICPSWLYPITMGATTIWERWDSMLPDGSINPGEMTSFNHYALGAVGDWMHKKILGMRAISPGWREIAIEPVPGGGLMWAKGEQLTPSGTLRVLWYITTEDGDENSVFHLKVVVPPNTSAVVTLPCSGKVEKVGSGERSWHEVYKPEAWPPSALYPPFAVRTDALPEDEVLPLPTA
ncbi:hypothetical protein CKM354_001154700 [Cercospora kikuchii]|uniref:alpha-L-rhamnosidase n=1 Tax=Cercospora kikuchii TaxID=84275 RepID=A0A9P3CPQ4_9PEZI|nr:uncharacterized protein CKM354_001154700 [Cercospora kikuchii]GIZ48489.1 hypothetical protein CKM354_001154700 [Cercospora kikuchii]